MEVANILSDSNIKTMAEPVLVVGAGSAGLIAALAAARKGARVEIFDIVDPLTANAEEEGNTSRSTGLIPAAGTQLQRDAGIIDDTPELMALEIIDANKGQCDTDLVLAVCCGARYSMRFELLHQSMFVIHLHIPEQGCDRLDDSGIWR